MERITKRIYGDESILEGNLCNGAPPLPPEERKGFLAHPARLERRIFCSQRFVSSWEGFWSFEQVERGRVNVRGRPNVLNLTSFLASPRAVARNLIAPHRTTEPVRSDSASSPVQIVIHDPSLRDPLVHPDLFALI